MGDRLIFVTPGALSSVRFGLKRQALILSPPLADCSSLTTEITRRLLAPVIVLPGFRPKDADR
jgi:hypothetical protein